VGPEASVPAEPSVRSKYLTENFVNW
jgi:hypothetical protein